ncbi:hypothetical protein [Deinococcus marmoris]|uniref:hypothetical protein n=1 Tax=Deinococcus marmoris TaxID=249408 RepID=UPI0011152FCA|nr:hypothetical protein [Deinococcus marmoris]
MLLIGGALLDQRTEHILDALQGVAPQKGEALFHNGSDSFQQVRCQQNGIFQPLPELNSIRHRHLD